MYFFLKLHAFHDHSQLTFRLALSSDVQQTLLFQETSSGGHLLPGHFLTVCPGDTFFCPTPPPQGEGRFALSGEHCPSLSQEKVAFLQAALQHARGGQGGMTTLQVTGSPHSVPEWRRGHFCFCSGWRLSTPRLLFQCPKMDARFYLLIFLVNLQALSVFTVMRRVLYYFWGSWSVINKILFLEGYYWEVTFSFAFFLFYPFIWRWVELSAFLYFRILARSGIFNFLFNQRCLLDQFKKTPFNYNIFLIPTIVFFQLYAPTWNFHPLSRNPCCSTSVSWQLCSCTSFAFELTTVALGVNHSTFCLGFFGLALAFGVISSVDSVLWPTPSSRTRNTRFWRRKCTPPWIRRYTSFCTSPISFAQRFTNAWEWEIQYIS